MSDDAKPAGNKGKVAGVSAIVATMIAAVLAVEGGYVNDPVDRGGETNMGITKRVAVQNGYTGPMRTLPREVAESIYYKRYLVEPGFDKLIPIDAAVTWELFDTGVNMGPGRAAGFLQASLNDVCGSKLVVDRRVGPATIAAFQDCQKRDDPARVCVRMLTEMDRRQLDFYRAIVRRDPSQRRFLKGWTNHRINNVDRRLCNMERAA